MGTARQLEMERLEEEREKRIEHLRRVVGWQPGRSRAGGALSARGSGAAADAGERWRAAAAAEARGVDGALAAGLGPSACVTSNAQRGRAAKSCAKRGTAEGNVFGRAWRRVWRSESREARYACESRWRDA